MVVEGTTSLHSCPAELASLHQDLPLPLSSVLSAPPQGIHLNLFVYVWVDVSPLYEGLWGQGLALTVVFSRQCSRWWCWLSMREVVFPICSSSGVPWKEKGRLSLGQWLPVIHASSFLHRDQLKLQDMIFWGPWPKLVWGPCEQGTKTWQRYFTRMQIGAQGKHHDGSTSLHPLPVWSLQYLPTIPVPH